MERSRIVSSACFVALLYAVPHAFLTAARAAAPEAAAIELEEVIVTAQKREQDLQKVATAVSAVSSDDLNREVIRSTVDLQGVVPGAIFISNTSIALRGIANNSLGTSGIANDQSVSIFVDGIVNPRSNPGLLYDVERVEVLRGPQGTLYGRNNTAGAMNIFDRRPTKEFRGSVSAEAGAYSRLSTEGMINLPLSDLAQLRTSFVTVRHAAYQSDGYGTQDDAAGRVRLQLTPTDNLTLLLGVDYEHNAGLALTPAFYPPGAPNPTGVPYTPWAGTPVCANGIFVLRANCVGSDASTDNSLTGYLGQLDWNIGFANLTYLGGYRDGKVNNATYGGSGTTHMFNRNRDRWQSHELRLANADESAVKWVAGAYYFYESVNTLAVQQPSPTLPPTNPLANFYSQGVTGPASSQSKAAFAQGTIPLTARFRLTGGIRYTKDDKVSHQGNFSTPGLRDPAPAGTTFFDLTYGKSATNYKVGAEADLRENVLGYVDYSTGYKAGGFFNAFGNNTFLPETIKAYQAGVKSRFAENRVQLNVDGYYYDYNNFQISTIGLAQTLPPPAPLANALVTLNAEAARFYGGELEGIVLLSGNDRIQGNVSLQKTELTRFRIPPSPLGPSVLDGFDAPYAPTASGRLSYRHTFNLVNAARLEAQAQVDYSSSYWIQIQHISGSQQASFHRVGVDVTYVSADEKWRLNAYGRNLGNVSTIQSYLFSLNPAQPSSAQISGEPRTYGLRLTANF